MGDYCFSRVTTREKDRTFFEEMGYESNEEYGGVEPAIMLTDNQANYGNHSRLMESTGRVFMVQNDEGSEYGPSAYVSDGRRTLTVEATREGSAVIAVDIDGISGAESIINFYRLWIRTAKKLGVADHHDAERARVVLRGVRSMARTAARTNAVLQAIKNAEKEQVGR